MRKIFFNGLLTMCTLAVTLASCNNENEVPETPQKTGNVFMKLNLGQKADTRANEPQLGTGTTAMVNSLHVYFYKDSDKSIQKYLRVDATTTPSITALTTGAQIADVPAIADKVLIRGNVPAGMSLPTSGLITGVENMEVEITTQNNKDNILLTHLAASIQTYGGGSAAPIAGMQNGDKYAEIELEPAVARIEVEGLQVTNGAAISGFSLDGIYLTNFYQKLKMGDGSSVTQVQYGADQSKYDENSAGTLYTTANKEKLFEKFAAPLAANGTPLAVVCTPANNRWTYHVFANDATTANDQLQLVFKLSNLQASAGSGLVFPAGTPQFLTVRGFKDNAGNIVKLEKGKIYTVSKTDFEFSESNLSTVPNTNAVGVWLKVTVKPWTVVAVKPNL